MTEQRENWSGQLGFIIAAAASAVGLGNLWRFPASAAKGGGGIFLLCYILLFVGFGLFLLMTEVAIGRGTGLSPIDAFKKLAKEHNKSSWWQVVGWLGTIVPFLILPYYSVIGGWVTKYLGRYLFEGMIDADKTGAFFESFIGSPSNAIAYMLVFALATFVFIFMGVQKGVERSNKVMMPALLFLIIGMAGYVICQPGMMGGIKYYLVPDFSRLSVDGHLSLPLVSQAVLTAMSQMFFSLSLAMGIMITYGSYVPKSTNLTKSCFHIGLCDTFVAFVAGMIVIPTAFKFGGAELAQKAGPGLVFVSLPQVFVEMPGARIVAIVFFVLVFFAALTSCMSIAETCVASLCDRTHMSRRAGTAITMVYTLVAAIPSAVSLNFLDKTDQITNNFMMPICAFFTCVFIGWVVGPKFVRDEAEADGKAKMPVYWYFRILIRYIAPLIILLIFLDPLYRFVCYLWQTFRGAGC